MASAVYSTPNMRKRKASEANNETPYIIPTDTAADIAGSLTKWFNLNQRNLNFRSTTDPYAIMVSEFMLQQTTVAAVEPYFASFMKRYPTIQELASAPENDVMAMWAGLGYYRRARQLHAAAKTVACEMGGEFPQEPAQLQKLPGFGRYTAGAVASQAFDHSAPILEANTIRVFARLAGAIGMIGESTFMNQLWRVSEDLVSTAKSPRHFNRAAMELGALVCRPKPDCLLCPVRSKCSAYIGGFVETTPATRPRKANVNLEVTGLALQDTNGKYAVRQIPAGQWHAGLWEFPTIKADNSLNDTQNLAKVIAGVVPDALLSNIEHLLTLKYQVTHHKVICTVFHCHVYNAPPQEVCDDAGVRFLSLAEISSLPLGSAQKKLLRYLENRNGRPKAL